MRPHDVLQLDIAGTPQDWLSFEEAASLIYAGSVGWSFGPKIATLRGGVSRLSGEQSTLDIPAVIATSGQSKINLADQIPPLSRYNYKLFARDRHMCAYCGEVFHTKKLTREHVFPRAQGGKYVWNNVVTACSPCNNRKGNRTPEAANMKLLYTPYTPNWFEDMLLQRGGRRILADQMEFLMAKVPMNSRLRLA